MTFKRSLFLLLVFIYISVQGQNRFMRRADKAFNRGDYPEAISNYRNLKEKNPEINRKLAQSYFFLKNYEQAEKYYQKIYDSEKTSQDLLNLSQIYLDHANYQAAILLTERALDAGADPDLISNRLKEIQKIVEGKEKITDLKLIPLEVQPKEKCLGITNSPDGLLFSNRSARNPNAPKTYQFFESKFLDGKYVDVKPFAYKLDNKIDLGAACFSADGTVMYYTRWYSRKGKQQMEIVEAEKRKGEWHAKALLPFNSRKYSCCYPYLSADGQSIYFSSDMPGGNGGMDLYVSKKTGKSWTKPVNLGDKINTPQDEIYPRILKDGTLWFSSDGHVGYGKLDLYYVARNASGVWGDVKNAGYLFNSSYNDYSILDKDKYHLLVSDREERGLRDRIYKIEVDEKEGVRLLVKDKTTNERIYDAQVRIKRTISNEKIVQLNKANGQGEYHFKVSKSDLNKGILYEIKLEKSNYTSQLIQYYPSDSNLDLELYLEKIVKSDDLQFVEELESIHYPNKKVVFKNIYFASNENELNNEAKKELDRFVSFWKIFPDLGIRINGHTDSQGSAYSNQLLSLKRANKAKEYLISKGVVAGKISVNAYGEKFILNGCIDGVECTEEEHQENRRIELIFVF